MARRVVAVCSSLLVLVSIAARAERVPLTAEPIPRAQCGPGDLPETGLQGEVPQADQDSGRSRLGYICNVRLVGNTTINGLGLDKAQMTWYGDCAYVMTKGNTAIAVIDASDPASPQVVQIVPNPAGITHEGPHANAARGLLVLPDGDALPGQIRSAKVAILDLKPDCRYPKLITVYDAGVMGTGIHSGELSADGRTYYATFAYVTPCMVVIDLDDPAHPQTMGTYGETYPCHDLDISRDGTRAYIGSYGSGVEGLGSFNPLPTQNLGTSVNPLAAAGLEIVDTTGVQARSGGASIRRISTINSGRPHSQALVHIGDRSYVFESAEGGCANGVARIVDVTDETKPFVASDLGTEYQVDSTCVEEWPQDPPANVIYMYWTHNFGFDSADDTASAREPRDVHIAFLTAYGAGLRVIDVADPAHPREIGYYNPPVPAGKSATHDITRTWVRYRPETGDIWFASTYSGFNIVRLVD